MKKREKPKRKTISVPVHLPQRENHAVGPGDSLNSIDMRIYKKKSGDNPGKRTNTYMNRSRQTNNNKKTSKRKDDSKKGVTGEARHCHSTRGPVNCKLLSVHRQKRTLVKQKHIPTD